VRGDVFQCLDLAGVLGVAHAEHLGDRLQVGGILMHLKSATAPAEYGELWLARHHAEREQVHDAYGR
jgi:hypothetical protein